MVRDGLFHQQQAILRNALTAENAFWTLARSGYAWRRKVKSALGSSLPLLLITFIHLAFFAAAGLFASQVTNTNAGQALVQMGGPCGFPAEVADPRTQDDANTSPDQLLALNTEALLGRLTITKSASYVRTCYNDDINSAMAICNLYVTPHLIGVDASAVTNATCPFGSNACTTPAVRYDSGHIHSSADLGINYRDSDSLTWRRVTTCAPIDGERYTTGWKDNVKITYGSLPTTRAKFYNFGKGWNGCEVDNSTTDTTTFCVTEYQKQNYLDAYSVAANTAYFRNETASDLAPIGDFNVTEADVTLISVFSRAEYTGNSTDPIFNAMNVTLKSSQLYTITKDLSFLGCTEQYQLCNVGNSRCTALTGLYGVRQAVQNGELELNGIQGATFNLVWKSAWSMAMQWTLLLLADSVLLARDWVFAVRSVTSSGLPPDQWQQESYNLHNLSLAIFQRRINEYASPENFEIRPNVNSFDQLIKPTDPNMIALCGVQKIRSAGHYSFSVLGMTIILVIGTFMILLDWFLVQYIFWFRALTHHRLAKKADWQSTGALQLHRQALEARGVGPWDSRGNYQFPALTRRCQTFASVGAPSGANTPLYDQGYKTPCNGGEYSALRNVSAGPDIEIQPLGDDKSHNKDQK